MIATDIIKFAQDNLQQGSFVALVTLTDTSHHTPGVTGSLMAVLPDGTICGTVGGGPIEAKLIEEAKLCLKDKSITSFNYTLAQLGMTCGGEVSGFINVLQPAPRVIIFGGGHVAQATSKIANAVNFKVIIVEERDEFRNFFDENTQYTSLPAAQAIEQLKLTEIDYCLIVTKGHDTDMQALEELCKHKTGYIGMIGSVKKIKNIFNKLREKGFSEEELNKVYAPIGLDIDNGTVPEIALAIIAEIVAVKNKKKPIHLHEKLPIKSNITKS